MLGPILFLYFESQSEIHVTLLMEGAVPIRVAQ